MGSLSNITAMTVTATGSPLSLQVPIAPRGTGSSAQVGYSFIEVVNNTAWGTSGATSLVGLASWNAGMANGTANVLSNTVSAATVEWSTLAAPNGIYQGATYPATFGPQMTITSITNANPAVVTVSSTGSLMNGDKVYIAFATGMAQINAMTFTVNNVTATTFDLPFLDASGFAAAATAGKCSYVRGFIGVKPAANQITAVTTGTTTTITLAASVADSWEVNQMMLLSIPSLYGNFESVNVTPGQGVLNNYAGYQILSINTATNQVELDVDTTSNGPFAFPANSTVVSLTGSLSLKAQAAPTGTYWADYGVPFSNPNSNVILLGSGVCGSLGDILVVKAVAADN